LPDRLPGALCFQVLPSELTEARLGAAKPDPCNPSFQTSPGCSPDTLKYHQQAQPLFL